MCASWDRAAVPDDGRSRDTLLLSVEGRGQSPSMAVASNGVLTSGWCYILAVGGDGVSLSFSFLSFPFTLPLAFFSYLFVCVFYSWVGYLQLNIILYYTILYKWVSIGY